MTGSSGVSLRAGAGDRVLDRRLAPALGPADDQEPPRVRRQHAGTGRRARDGKGEIASYQRMVSTLRRAGIRAELYLGSSGMKAQMKYADRRGSPCAIIQGSDKRARGEVQIKDLIEGAKAAGHRVERRVEIRPPSAVFRVGRQAGRRG